MPSPRSFTMLFIVGSTFPFFILACLKNSWWCFSSSFSDFEDRRGVPLKSLPVLPKLRTSSLMPSSHNCFRLWEFFSPIRSNSRVFSAWLSGVHQFRFIHSQLLALVLKILPVHHSSILLSTRDLFVHLYLNPLKYLLLFSYSSRCFFIFLRSFPILTVAIQDFFFLAIIFIYSLSILTVISLRVLFLGYHINSFVVSIPPEFM